MTVEKESFTTQHKYYPNQTMGVAYGWDKHQSWIMHVVCDYNGNGRYSVLYHNTYINEKCARRAYLRQVRKLKNGDY